MIAEKTPVCLVSDPNKTGVVLSVSGEGKSAQYSVFIDGTFRVFFEEQIRPLEVKKTNWVDRDTFRSYLTSCLITTPSARNLYSLNSARIDYVPYQFRPVLKMLKSDEPRILIADSVGVGKTIEAGLIIKELQAHSGVNKIAIICPKPLVAEKKWENEMRERFDEDFTALDGAALRDALSETEREGEWPAKLSRVIIPYSILDEMALRGNKEQVGKRARGRVFGLEDVAKYLSFDLVIVDEAHHIRNGSELSEKHFAYKCTKIFCDRADAVVMLTATPLQNRTSDLFTLLNVLRPDLVIDFQSFQLMAEPNPYVSRASQLARAAIPDWRNLAREQMGAIAETFWGKSYIITNPLFDKCIKLLERKTELTDEERVAFISDVESLHSFSSMISRTRRRDIEDFCVREPRSIRIPFTLEQDDLHRELLNFEHTALAAMHGERTVPFMMTTIKRQAASCIFGLAPYMEAILNRRIRQIDSAYYSNEERNLEMSGPVIERLREMAEHVIAMAKNLSPEDPKIDAVIEVLHEKATQEKNKVMLFSAFHHTLDYVQEKLTREGFRIGRIDGTIKDEDRRALRNRFMLPKEDEDAIDVMLFSEVGSEGLDYQFCDMMVNYDLPWNPMAVEQRIGRIDRRKQTSKKVLIVNVITPGTIDAAIYDRCLSKLGIFTASIGECEEILGSVEDDITKIALDDKLTIEQQEKKLAQIADNAIRATQEELKLEESQREFFGLDIGGMRDAKAVEQAKSPWLSEACIQGLVEFYLNERLGAGVYIKGEGARKTLRLSMEAKEKLLEDLRAARLPRNATLLDWQNYLKGFDQTQAITFNREEAQNDNRAFFFTPVHPLVKTAATYFDKVHGDGDPCIAFRCSNVGIEPGRYPFAVYAWNYVGFNSQFKLKTIPLEERLKNSLPSIVQEASQFMLEGDASDLWRDIDPIHSLLWRNAKDEWVSDVHTQADYKRQTLKMSYERKKLAIQEKLEKNADKRMDLMYRTQLDNETERYEKKLRSIEDTESRADIVFRKIANGMILVED